jgi:hypothetical protein
MMTRERLSPFLHTKMDTHGLIFSQVDEMLEVCVLIYLRSYWSERRAQDSLVDCLKAFDDALRY